MSKIYSEPSPGKQQADNLEPKSETIAFLLNYSKALSVIHYKTMRFEALIN